MKDKAFIDTNILIYLYSEDEPDKMVISQSIFDKYQCVTSTQVLNELSNVMTKKFKINPYNVSIAIDEIIANCQISMIGINTIKVALDISERYQYSYYDSLIISSALENDCIILLTEDLHDGQQIDKSLLIKNIFVKL